MQRKIIISQLKDYDFLVSSGCYINGQKKQFYLKQIEVEM